MAVTQVNYTGNGSTTNYSFTFPYLEKTDVQVRIDGTIQATTAYSFANATTIALNSAPASGAKIAILRNTNNDSKKGTFYAGSAIKAEDLNDNFDQILYVAQEVDNYAMTSDGTTPMTGDLVLGEDLSVIFEGATDDAYETTLTVADPTADRTITLPNVTGTVVTTGDTGTITATMLAANSVDSSELVDGSVDLSHMSANSVDSNQYVDGSIDHVHLANDVIDGDNIQDDVINSEHIAAGAVDLEHMSANSVDSDQYVDGSIDRVHLEADIIDGTKIADNAVDSEHITAGSIDLAHMSVNSIDSDQYVDGSIDRVHLSADIIDGTKIADNSLDSEHYVDGSIDRVHLEADIIDSTKLADNAVGTEHIQANSVTTSEIDDAELTTLAGMQSGTASILAGGTALTSTLSELNLLDGKSIVTTVSGSSTDVQLPTAKAVNDQILSITNALGGFVAIADKDNFPTSNPDPSDGAGTVVSISNAAGISVNSSGVGSLATRAGGSDAVIINGFPSALRGGATVGSATNANPYILPSNVGLQVQTTTTAHTYDYHKYLINEEDANKLSGDIQDFQERYRVASSAPTSSKDNGDLWFDTTNAKMMVYNGSTSAWEEVTSTGSFNINTISSYSGTGGNSATFNGSAYRFVLSNPPTEAQQLLVSINGVVQKPNAGTGQPSEGFAINGTSIIFSAAPASGSDYFIITIGSSVDIGSPSDNTVATAKIQNLAVTTDKIANDAVTGAKIADLDANVKWVDNSKATFGTGSDFEIYHDGTNNYLVSGTGLIRLRHSTEDAIITNANGAVELYWDNSKKFETQSTGVSVWGNLFMNNTDGQYLKFGAANDLVIYHHSNNWSYITHSGSGNLGIESANDISIRNTNGEKYVYCDKDGAAELYYDDSRKFRTISDGIEVTGSEWITEGTIYLEKSGVHHHRILANDTGNDLAFQQSSDTGANTNFTTYLRIKDGGDIALPVDDKKLLIGAGGDLQLYHDGSNSYIKNDTGDLAIESAGDVVLRVAGSENAIKCLDNSGVELYHNNNKRLTTLDAGVQLDESLFLYDSKKIELGHGGDLQLYHDGSNSYIKDTGTGDLNIAGSIVRLQSSGGETLSRGVENGAFELYYDNVKKFESTANGITVSGQAQIDGNCFPYSDDASDLGLSSNRWDVVYAANGTIQTSDKNEKNTIIESDLGLNFVNKLKPVSYKWNKDDSKTHYGLIAQDVEETLSTEGKTDQDFAALNIPTDGPIGLNYSELISPLIKAIQELSAEVETLKTKVAALEAS